MIEDNRTIESVYYHEGNRFSVSFKDDGMLTFMELPRPFCRENVTKIITDVPDGEDLWMEYRFYWNRWYASSLKDGFVRIHIHDIDDINTGGWDHGKHGSGSTTRVN